jgi:hypothetical protein
VTPGEHTILSANVTSVITVSNFGGSTSNSFTGGFLFGASGLLISGLVVLPLDATFSSFTLILAATFGTINDGGNPLGSWI